ncbi:MAG: hypothetical protein HYU81_01480 [Candidatus Brennerbacteria bacterium]|nr:hypothetical protein [Candidatus Brennerbacteria bacterium]
MVEDFERKPLDIVPGTTKERADATHPASVVETPPPLSFSEKVRIAARSIAFAAGAVLAVVAIAGGGLYFFFSREASRGIILTLEAPEEVMSGVPFDVVVNAENTIDGIAREATVSLDLPENVVALGALSGGERMVEETIGDIGGRSIAKRAFRLMAVGNPGTEKEIEVSLLYVSGGRSRFKADERATFTVKTSGIRTIVRMPERVVGNSSFEFTIEYENISPFDFTGVALEAHYPAPFVFQSASLPPDSLNNYWKFGALNAGSKGTIIVKGAVAAAGETSASFGVSASANFLGKDYTIAETEADAPLAPSPLFLEITANGSGDYVSRAGDLVTYLIRYRNQTGVTLADLTIRATLAGEMYDLNSVGTQGRVNVAARTISWDALNVPSLRIVDPDVAGEVALAIPLKASFPIRRLSDKNYAVRLTVNAESPSVPSYLSADKTAATAILETKLAGFALVGARGFYRDAAAGVVNAGAFPPKVGAATEYTVHWIVKNFSTDVEGGKVRAALPPEVAWTGIASASVGEPPRFEEETREAVWEIGKIAAGKGIVNTPLEAVFQVRAAPTPSQEGKFQAILGPTVFSATDVWTGTALSSRAAAITTALEDDPTVAEGQGRVVP